MRFLTLIAFFTILSHYGFAQSGSLLASYSESNLTGEGVSAGAKVEAVLEKLRAKRTKSDHQFLRAVFNITHRQLLKQYEQYASFDEIFESGKYDCLTATTLYSALLKDLGYQYTTIETDFHIFILVHSAEGDVLFESTDPLDGFVNQPDQIEARIASFKADSMSPLFREVSNTELIGLLYYNQSVKAFNNREWSRSLELLSKARSCYQSSRISELETLLANVMTEVAALDRQSTRSMLASKP